MACEYCDGNEKDLQVQPLSDRRPDSAFICPDGAPALCIFVDGEGIYLNIDYCTKCGRDLRGDAE